MENVENNKEYFSKAGRKWSNAQCPQLMRGRAGGYAVWTESPCPLPRLGSAWPRARPPWSLLHGSVPEPSQGHRSPEEIHPLGRDFPSPWTDVGLTWSRGEGPREAELQREVIPSASWLYWGCSTLVLSFPTFAVMLRETLGLVKSISSWLESLDSGLGPRDGT